ncbi:MAG: TPR repeat protein, partial [Myxococcota bacterium]
RHRDADRRESERYDALAHTLKVAACAAHDAYACYWAAVDFGDEGAASTPKATRYYRWALQFAEERCDKGYGTECATYGYWRSPHDMMVMSVDAIKPDLSATRAFFIRACRLDHGPGCWALGNTYQRGEGGARDVPAARKAFEKACKLDHQSGCISLRSLNKTFPKR